MQTLRILALGLALLATVLFFAAQIEGYLSPRMFTRISTSAAVVVVAGSSHGVTSTTHRTNRRGPTSRSQTGHPPPN